MPPQSFMCPVLVSRTGLSAVATMHQNSPLISLFVIRAEVLFLNTNALEQQHSHQIARSPFIQSVLLVAFDVHRVLNVDGVSTACVSSHSVCTVSPRRSSLVSGLVCFAVHVHSCPRVRSSSCSKPILHFCCHFLHTHYRTQIF